MSSLDEVVSEALCAFDRVSALALAVFSRDAVTVEIRPKPHVAPKNLPFGKIAVYAFFLNGQALKIGKVGPNSAARYISQHYNPNSAGSPLARSILDHQEEVGAIGVGPESVGDWIKKNTDRVNLLVPVDFGLPMLSLLESFLHVRWKPLFEGRAQSD